MWISPEKLDEIKGDLIKEYAEKLKEADKRYSEWRAEHETEFSNFRKDQEIILKRKDQEVENKVYEKTSALRVENDKLRVENQNLKKEVDILTKAFENLGFDVKDMKDILNKLVDGIVEKGKIQLIKN